MPYQASRWRLVFQASVATRSPSLMPSRVRRCATLQRARRDRAIGRCGASALRPAARPPRPACWMPAKSMTLWSSSGQSCISPSMASSLRRSHVSLERAAKCSTRRGLAMPPICGALKCATRALQSRAHRSNGVADARCTRAERPALRVWFRLIRLEARHRRRGLASGCARSASRCRNATC